MRTCDSQRPCSSGLFLAFLLVEEEYEVDSKEADQRGEGRGGEEEEVEEEREKESDRDRDRESL